MFILDRFTQQFADAAVVSTEKMESAVFQAEQKIGKF